MSRRQQIIERRKLAKKLDDLSSQIFAASLIDEVEDAVVVHDGMKDGEAGSSATAAAANGSEPLSSEGEKDAS